MSSEMKIDAALAKLESGKFSFQMADAIKNHVSKLECELEVARSLHASAIRDLKLKEYANWRLEAELRRLNAKIYALLRANILTEKAYRQLMHVATKMEGYFEASSKAARVALERAAADLKSGKFQAQFRSASSKLYELLKANAPTEKTFREMQPYAIKMGAYLEASLKLARTALERAAADLKSGKFHAQVVDASSKIYELLKANAPTEKTFREMQPYAIKMGEYSEVLKKRAAAVMVRATAYLSNLHKTSA